MLWDGCDRTATMQPGLTQAHIARANRPRLLFGSAPIAVGSGLAALFSHWFPLILVLSGVIELGIWLLRSINSSAHPIYQYLARLGELQQMIRQVNEEFAGLKPSGASQFGIN